MEGIESEISFHILIHIKHFVKQMSYLKSTLYFNLCCNWKYVYITANLDTIAATFLSRSIPQYNNNNNNSKL